jgi:hypothetical protein
MKERDAPFGAILIFSKPGLSQIYWTLRLASCLSLVRFVSMIPRFAAYAVSLLAIGFLVSGCASRDENVVEESTAAPSAPMLGKPVYNPGEEGMSASHEMGTGGGVTGGVGSGGNGVTPY